MIERQFSFRIVLSLWCASLCYSAEVNTNVLIYEGNQRQDFQRYRWQRDNEPTMTFDEIVAQVAESANISQSCKDGWEYLQTHTQTLVPGEPQYGSTTLHLRAVDAFGQPGAGRILGNLFAFGSYDECLKTEHTQYCLLNFPYTERQILLTPTYMYAMCVPQECTVLDVSTTSTGLVMTLQQNGVMTYVGPVAKKINCQTKEGPPYNAGAITMIAVCCFFILTTIVGTTFDWLSSIIFIRSKDESKKRDKDVEKNVENPPKETPKGQRSVISTFLLAFSLFRTVPTILSTKQPQSAVTCLNGIRAISMFWVILNHAVMRMNTKAGLIELDVIALSLYNQFLLNGAFPVDSFFLLSGLLVSYLTMRSLVRMKGRFPIVVFYVHRYLRLTPTYAFVLFFYWFLTMHLSDGPEYLARSGEDSALYQNCESYWWTNMLYISNIIPPNLGEECMRWTWYLSNDMQFFVISPLLLLLLYHSALLGFIAVGILMMGSFIASGAISSYYEFDNSYPGLQYFSGIRNVFNPTVMWADELYIKPYSRIQPYLVGILLGYILYRKVKVPFSVVTNWLIYFTFWAVAAILCMTTVYGLYVSYLDHPLNDTENIVYSSFSHFSWSIGVALVIFACHNGYGSVVNSFLSMDIWVPLGRVNLTAYLVHPIIFHVIVFSDRDYIFSTQVDVAVLVVAGGTLTYAIAVVVTAFVELPLANLEAIVLKLLGFGPRESTRLVNNASKDPVNKDKAENLELKPINSNEPIKDIKTD